jgi:hypothetical protein
VASIHAQKNRAGNTYRVLWRQDGRQRSLTFENLPAAERFKILLEDHGPDEALRIIELDEIGRHVPTVTEWLHTHIDNLTGVQPATLARYRTYVARDIDPVFGSMPVSAGLRAPTPWRSMHDLREGERELVSCLVTPPARAYGLQGRFHPLRIRHAGHIGCSGPSRWVQFVQFDQHKRLGTDFPSASHAGGRSCDPRPWHLTVGQHCYVA